VLAGVVVGVFTHGGDYSPTRSTTTRSDGGWQLRVPSPAPETVVCFDATKADGGLSPTGYLSRCYRDADWSRDPHHLPASAIRVALPANETRSGIDVTLPPAAAVNGTVRDAVSGDGLANVTVEVYDATHTDLVAPNAYTDSAGHYAVTGLAGSPGVLVCFVAGDARGGSTDTGYQPGCYRADGASAPTPVAVSPGSTAPDIDVALSPGGAFGGTVTAPPAYGEPPNILLSVFTADRQLAATVTATAAGNWQVGGLPPGNYTVCALVTNSDDIWPKCYVDVLWVDVVPPASATAVPVSVDHITRVHLSL
jgi:hypothetical protein